MGEPDGPEAVAAEMGLDFSPGPSEAGPESVSIAGHVPKLEDPEVLKEKKRKATEDEPQPLKPDARPASPPEVGCSNVR